VTLIRQLRDDAVDSSKSLPDLLRRAIVLGSLVRNDDLKAWAKRELDGYPGGEKLPEYRYVPAEVYGHFVGAFGRQVKNLPIPVLTMKDQRIKKILTEPIRFGNGVAGLETILEGPEPTVKIAIPTEICSLLPQVAADDLEPVQLWRELHKGAVRQILDSVRSRLLEIVLDLAERFPEINESETAMQKVDRKEAASIINNHIYGNSNVVAAGSNFSQSVRQSFEPHDIDALMLTLQQIGISGRECEELRTALKDDGKPKDGKLGSRVAKWIGSTTQKLLENGMTAAPMLLTEAVSRYYGWK
jgi:hypothetical protein